MLTVQKEEGGGVLERLWYCKLAVMIILGILVSVYRSDLSR